MAIRVVHLVTGLDVGGAETMLVRLVGRSDRRRFDHHVISLLESGTLAVPLEAQGIPVRSLSMRRGRPSIGAVVRLRRLLRELRPEILQTWMYHADVLGTLAVRFARGPRLVWNIRASNVEMRHYPRLTGVTRWLGARWSRRPDAVIVNSLAGQREHERLGFRPARWVVIPNGIDVDLFRPNPDSRLAVRRALGVNPAAPLIGLIARFDPMKDHETFIRAAGVVARARPDAHFLLAGAGVSPDNPQLRQWIAAEHLESRVSLLGPRDDVAALDAALDLAVLSSRFGEGFPTTVAEAMACGVPCVVTNVGDAAEIVGDTGWVVPTENPSGLAAACLAYLAASPTEQQRRREDARARVVLAYGLDRVTETYETLYADLAATAVR